MSRLKFAIEARCGGSQARAGRFRTLHSEVITPVFMPVGTRATVKSQTIESLKTTGAQVLLANTYHLLLRPGPEVFRRFGGIHRFMNWDGSVLTDSGGFQIFSLPHAREMKEEGATFQSYIDGKTHFLSPEISIATQKAIGSDIMMVLDQCIPSTAGHEEAKAAMELTHRWAVRSLEARGDSPQALFGIVQGACHHDLRRQSAEFLRGLPFDGMAIGGLAVGETSDLRYEFTGLVAGMLPEHLPRYLMGVGTPLDILEAVHRGVDMFDCIMPSQLGHRGTVYTSHGKMQLRRSVYKFAEEKLDAACDCLACRDYSRAYLHHLIKSDEPLGWHLLVTHNLAFYHRLMTEMRQRIFAGTFAAYYEKKRLELEREDEDNPGTPPRRNQIRIPRLGDYEVHFNPKGFASIKQISSGEIMHSVNPPAEEANRLYIEQSHLAGRLLNNSQTNSHEAGSTEPGYCPTCNNGLHNENPAKKSGFNDLINNSQAKAPETSGNFKKQISVVEDSSDSSSKSAAGHCSKSTVKPVVENVGKTVDEVGAKRQTGAIIDEQNISRQQQAADAEELVVWDVGLGAASNAMAAVRCFEKTVAENPAGLLRRLRLISFECDLDPLALAFKNNKSFPHLFHGAPARLLEKSRWQHSSGLCTWELVKGDFLALFEQAAVPDIMFFDPFSAKTDKSFWTLETFARLFRYIGGHNCELYTYSTSTAVRAALLSAGFFVANGIGTGPKESTTIAFTTRAAHAAHRSAPPLLGRDWLERWQRSGSRFPRGLEENQKDAFISSIESHPQFMSV